MFFIFAFALPAQTNSEKILQRTNAIKFLNQTKDYIRLKQIERARQHIEQAYALAPDHAEIKDYREKLAYPEIQLIPESEIFFYKEHPTLSLLLQYKAGSEERRGWTTSYQLTIRNEQGKTVREIKANETPGTALLFDGKDNQGNLLADGAYYAELQLTGKLGFSVPAESCRFLMLGSKLAAQISIKENSFAVGKQNVTIHTIYPDRTRVKDWLLTVTDNAGQVVRSIKGSNGLPATIVWDGKDNRGELCPSADIYQIVLTGVDRSGKKFTSNRDSIESEIEIIEKDGRLTFRMSTIQFASGKAEIQKNSLRLLDRVIVILKKYNWYDILVEGHTDNVGGDEVNDRLSLERARAVVTYLQNNSGLPPERFQATGMGERNPIADNSKESGRARNRRVEFILTEIKSRKS